VLEVQRRMILSWTRTGRSQDPRVGLAPVLAGLTHAVRPRALSPASRSGTFVSDGSAERRLEARVLAQL
jgi:hypothetical protein